MIPPWTLVSVAWAQQDAPAQAQQAPTPEATTATEAAPAGEPTPPAQAPAQEAPSVSSETVADPGAIPEGGFIGNEDFGAIPLGSGWGYVWAVYIVTWLTMLAYGGYLAVRNRSAS